VAREEDVPKENIGELTMENKTMSRNRGKVISIKKRLVINRFKKSLRKKLHPRKERLMKERGINVPPQSTPQDHTENQE
jgi:hypothetical protein